MTEPTTSTAAGTILVIDDSAEDFEAVRRAFALLDPSIGLSHLDDGAAALEQLREGGRELPSLIVLDLGLPMIDGIEVLAALKADPVLTRIPVIVMSGSEAEQDVSGSYEHGASCYVHKPAGAAAMHRTLSAIRPFWGQALARAV